MYAHEQRHVISFREGAENAMALAKKYLGEYDDFAECQAKARAAQQEIEGYYSKWRLREVHTRGAKNNPNTPDNDTCYTVIGPGVPPATEK